MGLTLGVHILAGVLGLISGYVALYAVKGATLHRKAGLIFVWAMLTMSMLGMLIAAGRGVAPAINVPAALLTSCLVITGLTAVRPLAASRWLDVGGTVLSLVAGVSSSTFGFEAIANGGTRNGIPPFPFFLFGIVGLLATAGDLRLIRSGALVGAPRLARHLWRMCFALFIAAMSFFIGQAKVIPKPLRIVPLLALPVLLVLATMLYWLWRVRSKRAARGLVVTASRLTDAAAPSTDSFVTRATPARASQPARLPGPTPAPAQTR